MTEAQQDIMRRIISFLLILMATTVNARQVSPDEAQSVAAEFFGSSNGSKHVRSKGIKRVAPKDATTDYQPYYVFNAADNAGFVIISGDTRAPKVLGYSDCNYIDTENMAPQLKGLLDCYTKLIKNIDSNVADHSSWSTTVNYISSNNKVLETAKWDQNAPYNKFCPEIDGQKTLTGCVATALAILTKYYEWPKHGNGTYSYEWNNQTLSFDYDIDFDWKNMLGIYYECNHSESQADAVATLMKACGIGCNMRYGVDKSLALTDYTIRFLLSNFNYACVIDRYSHGYYSCDKWIEMIKGEIDNQRPVIYTGSDGGTSHCFICDGYDDNNRLHFNWGWGGLGNGFFVHDDIDFSEYHLSGGGKFNFFQNIISHIQPKKSGDPNSSKLFLGYENFMMDKANLSNTEYVKVYLPSINKINWEPSYIGEIAVGLIRSDFTIKEILGTTKQTNYVTESNVITCRPTVQIDDGDMIALFEKEQGSDQWSQIVRLYVEYDENDHPFIKPSILPAIGNTNIPNFSSISYNVDYGIKYYSYAMSGSGEVSDSIIYDDRLMISILDRGGYTSLIGKIDDKPQSSLRRGYMLTDIIKPKYNIEIHGVMDTDLRNEFVVVNNPGTLWELIDKNDFSIGRLKVSGNLNAEDLAYLTEIVSWYSLDLSEVTIVSSSKEQTLPNEFLRQDQQILNIKLPSGITSIPYSGFEGCQNLGSVTVPDKVSVIGARAFAHTNTSIFLPECLESIGETAFTDGDTVVCLASTPPFIGDNNSPALVCVKKEALGNYTKAQGWKEIYESGRLKKLGLNINEEHKGEIFLKVGTITRLTAISYPDGMMPADLIWTSSHPDICTVDEYGFIHTMDEGEAIIRVSASDGSDYAECKVIVDAYPIEQIIFAQETIEMEKGDEVYLQYVINPPYASFPKLAFEVVDPAIVAVDLDGKVTSLSVGQTVVIATPVHKQDFEVSGNCTIIVRPTQVSEIILDRNTFEGSCGSSFKLNAIILPENATNKVIGWSNDNTEVAEVDANGLLKLLSPGTTTITASATDGSGVQAQCTVIVNTPSSIEDVPVDADTEVKIYSTTGVLLFEGRYSDAKLEEGIYIIVTPDKRFKRLIK